MWGFRARRLNKTEECRGHFRVDPGMGEGGAVSRPLTNDIVIHVEEDALILLHEIELALPLSCPCLA
jgi:hypothetical protein